MPISPASTTTDLAVSEASRTGLIARIRAHPSVAAVIAALGAMAGLGVVKGFLTDTAPWLASVLGPLAPVASDWAPVGLVGIAVAFGVYARLLRERIHAVEEQLVTMRSSGVAASSTTPSAVDYAVALKGEPDDGRAAIRDTMKALNTAMDRFEYDNDNGSYEAATEARQATLDAVVRVEAVPDAICRSRVRTFRDVFNVTRSGWKFRGGADASSVAALRSAHAEAVAALGAALRRLAGSEAA